MTFTVTEHQGPAGPWRVAGVEQDAADPLQVRIAVTRAMPHGRTGMSLAGTVTADGLTCEELHDHVDGPHITAALHAANLHLPTGAATLFADAAQAGLDRIRALRGRDDPYSRSTADGLVDRVATLDRLVAALSLAERDQRVTALAVVGAGFTGTAERLTAAVTAATAG